MISPPPPAVSSHDLITFMSSFYLIASLPSYIFCWFRSGGRWYLKECSGAMDSHVTLFLDIPILLQPLCASTMSIQHASAKRSVSIITK
ncbi:hypothetical protein BO82DRAFT_125599 [Aspergillus uvarum CBS 121591]|uniref:Uncharacterized protein n=1 Tax=Aspergillus uvarum CBS 121591 TaxID=1448315 RepID=A0A319CVS3_9EURO|nr:hypothetical protein BO82DRAFT_125599 [Aspergillus uvarum CBS 121591]PYH79668.1 hypothetical protein BO82DRAFT_125599 [Aspergillus uvarum CBS 121591]